MFGYDTLSPPPSGLDNSLIESYPTMNNCYQSCMMHSFAGTQSDVPLCPPDPDLLSVVTTIPELQIPQYSAGPIPTYEQPHYPLTPSSPLDFVSQNSPSLGSPHSSTSSPQQPRPTSVQMTRSQLIKEGLRVTIQTKRMAQGKHVIQPEYVMQSQESLTPEDEERRKRRRERNKLAATKCRNKKKERTQWLAVESNHLETDNSALKKEIQELQKKKSYLMELLQCHHCSVPQRSCALQVGYPPHHT